MTWFPHLREITMAKHSSRDTNSGSIDRLEEVNPSNDLNVVIVILSLFQAIAGP
jgi:hypothetical protein